MEFNNLLQEHIDALHALRNLRVQLVSADALEHEQKRLVTIKEQLEGKKDQAYTELGRAAPNNIKAALKAFEAAYEELQEHELTLRDFSMKRQETLSRNTTLEVDISNQAAACLVAVLALDPAFKEFISKTPPGRSDGTSEVTSEQTSLVVTLAFTPGRNPLNHEDLLVGLDDYSSLATSSISPLPDTAQIDSSKNIQGRADVRVEPQHAERHASPIEARDSSKATVASKHSNPVQRMRTPDDWPRWPEPHRENQPATAPPPEDEDLYDDDDYGDIIDDGEEPVISVVDDTILKKQAGSSSDFNLRPDASNQKRKRSLLSTKDKTTKDSSTPKKQRTRGPNKDKKLLRKEVGRAVMVIKTPITMNDLRGGFHKHFIVKHTGKDTEREEYFILRCDVCGVHFNENPIAGARTHLTTSPTHYSIQCRRRGKDKIRTDERLLLWRFGIPIQDCTSAIMEDHNQALAAAIERGDYVIRSTFGGKDKSRDMAYHPVHPAILIPRRQEKYKPPYKRESAPSPEAEQASGSTAGAISAITSDIPGPREHDQVYLFAPGEVYWFKGVTDSTHRPVVALPYENLRSIGLQDYDVSNIVKRLTSHLCYHKNHGYHHSLDTEPKRREWLYPVMYLDTVSENKSRFVLAQVDNTWHFERADIDEKNPTYHRLLRYLDRDELDLTFKETLSLEESRTESTQSAANSATNPQPREGSELVREMIEDDSSSESTISNRDYVTDKGKGKENVSPYKASAARRGPGSKPGYRSRISHATFFNPAFLDSAPNAVENTGESSARVRAPEAPM